MINFLVDLRYGMRMVRRSPGFTAVAVLTFALGIGATSSIFSVVKAVILNPLQFRQRENLVHLHSLSLVILTQSRKGDIIFSQATVSGLEESGM